jgi:hypothetical protein
MDQFALEKKKVRFSPALAEDKYVTLKELGTD